MSPDNRSQVLGLLKYVAENVVSALFPVKCPVCGDFYRNETASGGLEQNISYGPFFIRFKQLMSGVLCEKCSEGFVPVNSPLCIKCGIPFTSGKGDDRTCSECIHHPMKYRFARAVSIFDGPLIDIIHTFKYKGKIQLAKPLSVLMYATFLEYAEEFFYDDEAVDFIMPVPLHPKRFRNRGFNQAFLLIKSWEKISMQFGQDRFFNKIDRNVLFRKKYTESQTGLGKDERKKNLKNAFYVNPAKDLKGKGVLLIDDVYTTGATVNECAKVLVKSGARFVDVLTLARTVSSI